MSRNVHITTGARLHFGLFANRRHSGRQFGGVGVMIDVPGVELVARFNETDCINVTCDSLPADERENIAARVRNCVAASRSARRETPAAPCRIDVRRAIPLHIGLGAGTQLAMATARACAALAGDDAHYLALAERVGRGTRSAVGIHGFACGGLVVEGGKSAADQIGTLIARAELPNQWRFVLVTPRDRRGVSSNAERDAFAQLPAMDSRTTDRLCRIALLELLPSALRSDFGGFGEAIYDFGKTVGEYFSAVQGGTFADRRMAQLVSDLRRSGIHGVGQTSWGPTLFVLCRSQPEAEALVEQISSSDGGQNCTLRITRPLNASATVLCGDETKFPGKA